MKIDVKKTRAAAGACMLLFAAVLGGLIWFFSGALAQAQQYPARPIRLLVPFAPGGALDVVGRIVGQKLSEALGQPVVVDNRGGAGGTIGADIVAKAPPDGHTVLIASMGLAVNAVLYPKLPYDTLKDLAPVTMVGEQPNIVVVHPSVPVKSIEETTKILRSAALKEQFGALGLEAIPTSPEAFAQLLRADIGKWGKVIKAAGAKPG